MLRQRAERAETRTKREHHVGTRDQFHCRFGTLITERSACERVTGRERIVMQIAVDHRRRQILRQGDTVFNAICHHNAATGQNHRELRFGEQTRGSVERLRSARTAFDFLRRLDFIITFAVVIVARDVHLHRSALVHCDCEGTMQQLRHPER